MERDPATVLQRAEHWNATGALLYQNSRSDNENEILAGSLESMALGNFTFLSATLTSSFRAAQCRAVFFISILIRLVLSA